MTSSVLGFDIETGQRVEILQASRRQGTYIIGANGTGKTGLIENLVLQDTQQGLGVCLLDPHGDLTQAVLSRIPDSREFVSRFPNIIGSLCSADLGTIHSALSHMQKDAQEGSGISLISPPFTVN